MTRRDRISEDKLEEAMDWFLRLDAPTRTDEDAQAFALWLNGSAENRLAWEKACRTWEIMGAVKPVHDVSVRPAEDADQRRPKSLARRRNAGRKAIVTGIAALAACLVAVLAAPDILIRFEADHTTATAEIRQVTLEDGSTVQLGGASAIAVDFSAGTRQVRLLSGQAFFEVRPDASRPFTVKTGALDVTVVGTAFDVNITPEAETVQLAHGIVNLSRAGGDDPVRMEAGETVTLDRDSQRLSHATIDVDAIASWRDRRLFVQNAPVASVIAELQRYHPAWIKVASAELGQRRVTGLYDLSDPDRALEAVVRPFGGKVHAVSPYLRVLALF